MLPILLDLRIIKIYTFGVFLVLAFFWGLFWFWRNIKRTSYKEEQMFDIVFISMLGGLFISRLTYVFLNFEDFGFNILRFILINGYPGLSLLGGITGFMLVLFIACKFIKISFLEVSAYLIPSGLLALSIGKLGAFFGGSVVGTETSLFLAVPYVGHEGMRHITAVYESLILAIGFIISQRMLMRYRRDKLQVGSILSFFVVVLSLSMIMLDFIKVDTLYLLDVRFNVVFPAVVATGFIAWELYKYRSLLIPKRKKKHGRKSPK